VRISSEAGGVKGGFSGMRRMIFRWHWHTLGESTVLPGSISGY
jgi:hypothetical protein